MSQTLSQKEISESVSAVLSEMIQDWDLELDEPLTERSKIVEDLGFESVDLMQLMIAIEKKFNVRGLPFEKILMEDGGYATELSVGQLVGFLDATLSRCSGSVGEKLG